MGSPVGGTALSPHVRGSQSLGGGPSIGEVCEVQGLRVQTMLGATGPSAVTVLQCGHGNIVVCSPSMHL